MQGVWFRASAQEEALRLEVRGWARNRPDGSVEILAEGPPGAMREFLQWCHKGPPGARVSSVRDFPVDATSPLGQFRVRHG